MNIFEIFPFLNKFVGSRKAALWDQITNLTAEYNEALNNGEDTRAALIRKQIQMLREKGGFTEGEL